jgi:MFS family permease
MPSLAAYWRLLRTNRNVRRLWLAQVISEMGDWFHAVAIYSLLLELTGSARSVAIATVAMVLPQVLVAPMAGVVNDRIARRRVMIVADIARFFIMGGMLLAQSGDRIWLIYTLMFLETIMWGFFEPARSAILPNLCERDEDILVANALGSTTWAVNFFMGSALGGLLAASFGRNTVFIVNAASFLVSAWLIAKVRIQEKHAQHQPTLRWRDLFDFTPILDGWKYVREHAELRPLILIKAGVGLMGANWVLLPVLGETRFRLHGWGLGESQAGMLGMSILMGARGVGSFIGPMLARSGTDSAALRRIIALGFLIAAVGYFCFGMASGLLLAAAAVTVGHAGSSINYVLSSARVQMLSDDRFRGRVTSAEFALMMTSISISSYAAGVLIDAHVDPARVASGVGILMLLPLGVWLWTTRRSS